MFTDLQKRSLANEMVVLEKGGIWGACVKTHRRTARKTLVNT